MASEKAIDHATAELRDIFLSGRLIGNEADLRIAATAALDAAAAVDGDAQWNEAIEALVRIKELDSIKDDASMTMRLGPCGRIADAAIRSLKRG